MISRILILGLLLVCIFGSNAQTQLSNELQENIKLRVASGQNIGMVVGLIDSEGVKYYSYGVESLPTDEPVDENTVFEIGSVTKTFTGILLADQVKKGTMNLNDPIDMYLPNRMKTPAFDGEPIRLVQLSNHSSGLPPLPSNFAPADPSNPYADYSEEQLYEFLQRYELTRKAGSQYEYSNYAVGLLGHLLATKNGLGYEELMMQLITKPLGLKNTKITLNSKMEKQMAKGHNMGYEVGNWDLTTLAGAGAVRSTASDMVKFLKFNMGLEKHSLYEAMKLSHQPSSASGSLPVVGLGWHRAGVNSEIVWHNGGTGGYRSFIGFVEGENRGVVILTNSSEGVDDLALRILNPNSPLRPIKPSIAIKIRKTIDDKGIEAGFTAYQEAKEKESDKYEFGEYELQRLGNIYQVLEETEKAVAVLKLNIAAFPESSSSYSNLGEAYFRVDNKEVAIACFKKAITLNPANQHAIHQLKQLGVSTENLTEEVTVATELLESYIGKYELAPGFIVTVSLEGSQLKAQATGQQAFSIYPKSDNVFYFKAVEAQLTFNKGDEETIESVTLLQAGREIVGKKL